jgi:hypothetical protein
VLVVVCAVLGLENLCCSRVRECVVICQKKLIGSTGARVREFVLHCDLPKKNKF